ncbi:hypothetical protein Y032_0116g541 [Ancylostoma ceylanicum]|uniref:Uncharacterized protein n=1 Tax=Ancylostoma ceylanicum TaxID=53326 RepID=A0A016TCC7_9BILA|nr:hypothetical protein Y032_0116g541 [Ancylostoma ceylanicum]
MMMHPGGACITEMTQGKSVKTTQITLLLARESTCLPWVIPIMYPGAACVIERLPRVNGLTPHKFTHR